MRFSTLAAATMASVATAADPSICDKYTTALLKDNTAANQATLLTLIVNTVVIGNYSNASHSAVPGILAPGTAAGKQVNLKPYFDGTLASTNVGNKAGCKNFLDDGGAAPLMKNMPANGKTSNQYFLLTHLYEFFGTLLGCSQQGMTGFDKYGGDPSMYNVHKFMDLGEAELTYFITQVALTAKSFGVADADITTVGMALNSTFGMKCAAPAAVGAGVAVQPQAICIGTGCPQASSAVCSAYDATNVAPSTCSATGSATGSPTGSPTGSATGSMTMTSGAATGSKTAAPTTVPSTAAAVVNGVQVALAAAVAALAL